jgi:hypothetical protein
MLADPSARSIIDLATVISKVTSYIKIPLHILAVLDGVIDLRSDYAQWYSDEFDSQPPEDATGAISKLGQSN